MEQRLEPLFTPWKIGNCEIKNRIVLTSMGGTNLLGWMEVNHFDKAGARFIMEVAKNNCGLVLPGCQPGIQSMYGKWLYKNEKDVSGSGKVDAGISQDRCEALRAADGRVWTVLYDQQHDGNPVHE